MGVRIPPPAPKIIIQFIKVKNNRRKFGRKYFFIFFFLIIFVIFFIQFSGKPLFKNNFGFKKIKEIKNSLNNSSKNYFSFAIAGDNHNEIKFYQKIINYINQNQEKDKIAFFVDLGDSTKIGDYSEYLSNKDILNQLKVPYYMVLGDHDIVSEGMKFWEEFYGKRYYSWNYQDIHFIVLDDVSDINGLSEEQLIWLEEDLSKNFKKQKIVFLHRPPEAPFNEPQDLGFKGPKSKERIEKLIEILQKYKVNHIFAGHLHNLVEYSISGIPITVTGGAGGPIYNLPLVGKNKNHFLIVEILNNNLKYKIIEL